MCLGELARDCSALLWLDFCSQFGTCALNPIDRWDRGLRAADMYIVSVEKKRNLRTDGPHRVSVMAPTSILAIGGNFASGPPPAARTTSRNRPETARNPEVEKR